MISSYSRYRWSEQFQDEDNRSILSLRSTLDFAAYPGSMVHITEEHDTLESIAERYYEGMGEAAMLWWAIADFQPEPILDPTLRLTPGTKLLIPSAAVVQSFLLGVTETDALQG
jgi:nucleoid-associated protein YgaU